MRIGENLNQFDRVDFHYSHFDSSALEEVITLHEAEGGDMRVQSGESSRCERRFVSGADGRPIPCLSRRPARSNMFIIITPNLRVQIRWFRFDKNQANLLGSRRDGRMVSAFGHCKQ